MSDDLMLLRLLAVAGAPEQRELLREAATLIAVPVELVEAETAARARSIIASREIDLAIVDLATTGADHAAFVTAARAAKPAPLVILAAESRSAAMEQAAQGAVADAIAVKPTTVDQARVLIERC